jgi:predicted permease
VGTLLQDIRFGLRMLAKNPGFTAVAVLTLALGIGANTAIFSVVNAVLLNPLPYKDADRLVVVWKQNPSRGWYHNIISAADFLDLQKQNRVFAGMAAIKEEDINLTGEDVAEAVRGEQVTANFFDLLGVRAARGRTFVPDEGSPGGPPVVVLSDGLWKRRYGGDPAILGKQIAANGRKFTVVGVMPPGFYFAPWDEKAQFWRAGIDLSDPGHTNHWLRCVARLKSSITLQQAQAEMDTIMRRLEREFPDNTGWGVGLVNLHEQIVGNTRPALLVLLGAVGFVLLIACTNLANLQLARAAEREKEIAIRTALGANRRRLIRQLLTESVLLSMAGGGLGLLMAAWGTNLWVALAPQETPGLVQPRFDLLVLGFSLVLSLVTGMAFGLVPALGTSKPDLNQSLKESTRHATDDRGRHRLRALLVGSEFALALILMAGAGLMIRSLALLAGVRLGFDPRNVLTLRIPLRSARYQGQRTRVDFFQRLLQQVETLPGVIAAGTIDGGGLPPHGGNGMMFLIEGRPAPPPNEVPEAEHRVVSPGYFRAMGIRLASGRFFSDADTRDSQPVAIINETLARDYWPGRDPLGSRIQFPSSGNTPAKWVSIVGVIENVKNQTAELPTVPEVYVPYTQLPTIFNPETLVVRSATDPGQLVAAIRREVGQIDKEQPIFDVLTMEENVAHYSAGRRFPMILLSVFAGLALALAAVGIYGVLAFSVARRRHEIGIRMALGAAQDDILRLVVAQGFRFAVVGIIVGVAGALAVTRVLASLLFGVTPTDPLTFGAVTVLLGSVALLACYLPARRAAKVDPMVALRYE